MRERFFFLSPLHSLPPSLLCMAVLYMAFVSAVYPGIQQRGLVGWQAFDTHCRERAGEGECARACPAHRHTAAVGSQPSRTREKEREGERLADAEREREGLSKRRVSKMGGISTQKECVCVCVWEVPVVGVCLCALRWGYSMSGCAHSVKVDLKPNAMQISAIVKSFDCFCRHSFYMLNFKSEVIWQAPRSVVYCYICYRVLFLGVGNPRVSTVCGRVRACEGMMGVLRCLARSDRDLPTPRALTHLRLSKSKYRRNVRHNINGHLRRRYVTSPGLRRMQLKRQNAS